MLRRYFDHKFATAAVLLALASTYFTGVQSVAGKTASTPKAAATNQEKPRYSHYSKTSEFAQRLQLLEFADPNNQNSKKLDRLINDMRQKNYPIQRVEKAKGGAELFQLYRVKSAPTFVLLFDGQELGRVTVGRDDVATTRDRLLKLFQRGRDSVAANPRAREKEPVYLATNRPKFGFLFPGATRANHSVRAQSLDLAAAESSSAPVVDSSVLESREEELSAIIGEGRLNAGTARVVVDSPDGGAPRVGAGVVVHYNEEYREALIAVAASLFVGINDAFNSARVNVDVYSVEAQSCETKGAQCVYCDLDAGIAFVAAQVDHPATPVAFLPKRSPLEVGERAVVVYRDGANVVKSECDVLSLDQRRFYQTQGGSEENGSFLCVEISKAPTKENFGAGLFVERNERYYFAGLCVSSNSGEEGLVAPIALVSRSLLVNRNLATVYRDQISGKFDSAATDVEIDAAISRLIRRDVEKRAQTRARAESEIALNSTTGSSTGSSTGSTQENQTQDAFVLSAPKDRSSDALEPTATRDRDVSRAEDALDSASRAEPVASEFPADAEDAFARSDAAANALRDNDSESPFAVNSNFQFADLDLAPQNAASEPEPTPNPAPVAPTEPANVDSATLYAQTNPQPAPQSTPQSTPPSTPPTAPQAAPQTPLQTAPQAVAVADPTQNAEPTNVQSANQTSLYAQAPVAQPATNVSPEPVSGAASAPTQPRANDLDQLYARATDSPRRVPASNDDLNGAPNVNSSANQIANPNPNENLLAAVETVDPSVETRRASRYAPAENFDPLNRGAVRPTTFANAPAPEEVEAFDHEEAAFEAGIDALRRRSLEGAEIICIVNWAADSGSQRETEVVRLPRRTVLENPRIMKSGVELVDALPEDRARNASAAPILTDPSVPAVSNRPNGTIVK